MLVSLIIGVLNMEHSELVLRHSADKLCGINTYDCGVSDVTAGDENVGIEGIAICVHLFCGAENADVVIVSVRLLVEEVFHTDLEVELFCDRDEIREEGAVICVNVEIVILGDAVLYGMNNDLGNAHPGCELKAAKEVVVMYRISDLAIASLEIRVSLGEGNSDLFRVVAKLVSKSLALLIGKIEDVVIGLHLEKRVVDAVKARFLAHSDGFLVAKGIAHYAVIC